MDELLQSNYHPAEAEAFRQFLRDHGVAVGWTGNPDWPSNSYTVKLDGEKIYLESEEQHEPTVPFGADPHEVYTAADYTNEEGKSSTLKGLPGSAP